MSRLSLPLTQWPQQDRLLWEAAQKPADLFEEENVAASWAPRTCEGRERYYGRWLAWLIETGLLDQSQTPGERVTAARVLRYIAERKVSPVTTHISVSCLMRMLEAIASEHDWSWMATICRQLKRQAIPVRNKHSRIVDSSALFALGFRLIATAAARGSIFQATQARDGLIISLLAARPLRRGNLWSIEIGRHLRRIDDTYWLVFDKSETKNGRPIEVECPEELVPHIDGYLEFYRPMLLAEATPTLDTRRLWINRRGGIMAPNAIARQITVHTEAAFGRPINPHLFRDCAATSIAVHDPDHVRIASVILGHSRSTTTEKYYNQASMLTASREHHRAILTLRRKARKGR